MTTKLDEIYSLIDVAKSIKSTFLERIPFRESDKSYATHEKRKINEVLIKPIKFTSCDLFEYDESYKTTMSTSSFSFIPDDDIWITNDTNKYIEKYFIKYLNDHKNDIWNFIYKEIKKDASSEKENLLKEIDELKNDLLKI